MRLPRCFWQVIVTVGLAALPVMPRTAAAQGAASVRGTVTDSASRAPVQGVRIRVVGTTRAALTDSAGRYVIAGLVPGRVTVRARRIGYAESNRRVTARANEVTTVDFALTAVAARLSQVVVVGYGTQSRANVTGAVTQVTGAQVTNVPVAGIDAALQGKAAGIQVTQNSGDPGTGITVRIRGAASLSASNQPLYVVDGVPIHTSSLEQLTGINGQSTTGVTGLDPDEIASITVLKDAASAAIYGSRASNGVVLITTKRGQAGKSKISVDAYTGWQNAEKHLNLMNASQYVAYMNEGAVNDGESLPYPDSAYSNTDWQSAIFRTAPVSNVSVGISGGSDVTRYYVSGAYFDQKGIVLGSGYQRGSARANLDFSPSGRLQFRTSIGLSRETNDRIPGDNSLDGVVTNAIGNPNVYPIRTSSGAFTSPDDGLVYSNAVAIGTYFNAPATTDHVLANAQGTYDINSYLSFTGRAGADITTLHEQQWESPLVPGTYAASAGGVAKDGYNNDNHYTLESFLTYQNSGTGPNDLNIIGGASVESNHQHLNYVRGEGFSSDQFHYVRNATVITSFDGLPAQNNLASFFGRADYSYKNKYLLTGSLRFDGSSRFGPNNRWATFPAISAGWVISKEPFMGNFGKHFGSLKLRASYGVTGNQSLLGDPGLSDYAWQGTFGSSNYGSTPGIAPNNLANPNLKWETTHEFDAGFDWYPLGGRITVIGDYYHKLTSGLLVDRPVPSFSGFTNFWDNIGDILNRGFELGISSTNIEARRPGDFGWQTDFNISTNHNVITKLYGNQSYTSGNFRDISAVAVGQPLGEFYVLNFQGVDPATGNAIYQDVNGDGVINSLDRVYAGNPQPNWYGGLGNTLSWKGFQLHGFLEFSHGAKVFNLMRIFADDGGYYYDNKFAYALNRWQKPGDITNEPRASFDGTSGARDISSRFIEDGSYARIQDITVSWLLPPRIAALANMSHARLYVSGHNLHTFTKYSGYDPDVNSNGSATNVALGTDYYAYPRARSFTIGISSQW